MAKDARAIRCGSTIHPNQRKNAYSHDGYNGFMYYTAVHDMKLAEDHLLQSRNWPKNVHKKSNTSAGKPGYVYIISESRLM